MTKQKSFLNVYVLFLFLLLVFEIFSIQMTFIGTVSYYSQIVYLIAFVLSVFLLFKAGVLPSNFFLKLLVFWMLYISVRYVTSTTGHVGLVSFFRYTWFCNCYIIAYLAGRQFENREKALIVCVIGLLLIAAYYTYKNLMVINLGYLDVDSLNEASNIIFWSLCLVPSFFLLDKKLWQLFLFAVVAILVLLTMKRSAFISMVMILALFAISLLSGNDRMSKNKQRISVFLTVIIAVILVYIFSLQLSNLVENNLSRFEEIEEGGGSGRVDIWKDAIKGLENSNPLEWLFGHGVASTQETIRHTSCHNDFLTILLEFGIIGALLYISFIWRVLKRVIYTRKHNRKLFYCYASLAVILLVVGNVGDLFTCYTYLGFMMVILAAFELRLEKERKTAIYAHSRN